MSNKSMSRELMQEAVDAVALHGSQVKAAQALKVPRETLAARLRNAKTFGVTTAVDLDNVKDREITKLKDRVNDLQASLRASQREALTMGTIRREIFGMAERVPDPPAWLISDAKKTGSVTGVPLTLWSDWHFGETVRPEQVNGLNAYNTGIAQQRAELLVERIVDLCFNHMVNPKYPGVVINLGGDMISGEIHEELLRTNELTSIPACLNLTKILVRCLRAMADKFGRVFVTGVSGNHGRTTRRPSFKDLAQLNYDWLIYQMIEMRLEDDKRFSFHFPATADVFYQVYGHRYMLTHGDHIGTKGGDGIIGALGPILRGDTKMRNAATDNERYDTVLMGHWHQLLPLFPRLCVNGSLKGYDEYAKLELRARPEEPQQMLWFQHPTRGITCQWPVKVGQKRPAVSKEWLSLEVAA